MEHNGRIIVAMPGVPVEMRRMWEHEAAPRLRERTGGRIIFSKTLKIIGLGESSVGDMIHDLLDSNNPTLATYAKNDGIHVRITAKEASEEEATALIAEPERRVREILGDTVYGVDDETLEGVVGALLRDNRLTLATAEGLTAGLLSATIANVPGSSAYFKGGLVAYSGPAKELWGIDASLLSGGEILGPDIATALAAAARTELGADIGVGLSGVAGPEAVGDVPPGQFFLTVNNRGHILTDATAWKTTRNEVRRRAVLAALALIRRSVLAVEA